MGDELYEKRRRLERENAVLREEKENERLKNDVAVMVHGSAALKGLADLFAGRSYIETDGTRFRIVPPSD